MKNTLLILFFCVYLVGCQSNTSTIPETINYKGDVYENDGTFQKFSELNTEYYIKSGDIVESEGAHYGKQIYINVENDEILYVRTNNEDKDALIWIPYHKKDN